MRTTILRVPVCAVLLPLLSLLGPTGVRAGAYVFSGEANGVDLITHPPGYNGTGGTLTVSVCIDPTSANAAAMAAPVQNIVATINELAATTGNLVLGAANNVGASEVDFESVALHEVGHCLGMAHPNLATESGLTGADQNYTKSTDGADNVFDLGIGGDGYRGSPDDSRDDDVNLHWFRMSNNNPFTIAATVDASTYDRETSSLPGSDTFAANADRDVGANVFSVANTEAVMQQGTFNDEAQRTLNHDDVATLRLAMSGLDETAGTSDDYTIQLTYAGLTTSCDLVLDFDNAETGFAVCQTGGSFLAADHVVITSADLFFNTGFSWFFNELQGCQESTNLVQNQWTMVSLPCDVGASDTLEDVFGDDLDTADLGSTWAIFSRNESTQAYEAVDPSDALNEGEGYWIKTTQSGQSLTVEGDAPSVVEVALVADTAGRQNLVGHPFGYDVCWADVEVNDGMSLLSLDEADPVVGMTRACAQEPAHSSCVMSRVAYQWNGSAYDAYDGETPGMTGTLEAFEGLWVEAFDAGISLRIPDSESSSCCLPAPVADAGGGAFICNGGSATIGTAAQPDTTYSWSPGGATTAQIMVSPSVTTTYTVTATTSCGSAQDSVTVWVEEGLDEDFEGSVAGWTATGLWHHADDSACAPLSQAGYTSPTHAFYYGQEVSCDYDTGAANAGDLTSPTITGISPQSTFDFNFIKDIDASPDSFLIRIASGTTTQLYGLSNIQNWASITPISLAAFAGENITVSFEMDSVDATGNTGVGLFFDDVLVDGQAMCAGARSAASTRGLPEMAPILLESTTREPTVRRPGSLPREWFVRLIVSSGDLVDRGNVFGQIPTASDRVDRHDLRELAPFGSRYLTVVFPHDDWGPYSGDYTSDFRKPDPPLGDRWRFAVVGSGIEEKVTLRWEADGVELRGWWLVDELTREQIRVRPGGSHTFELPPDGRRTFQWIRGGRRAP